MDRIRIKYDRLHGDDALRMNNRGSAPIDGIFMTRDHYILQGGYPPFRKGIGSEHISLWIDIRAIVLMGQDLEPPSKFSAQQLKCDDPHIRNTYITHYEKFIKDKQILVRGQQLDETVQATGLTPDQAQVYEELDALGKKGVDEEQQQCRKLCTGNVDWTPKTTLLGLRVQFWKLPCNRAHGVKVQR
jgi:hypothetical protein